MIYSARKQIERNHFIHNSSQSTVIMCGSLPRQEGGWYDYSPNRNKGTITAGVWTQLSSGLWVMDFDGAAAKVAFAASALTVKTFMAWVNIDTKNLSIVDLDGGTHSVESDNSATAKLTATGWNLPTFYVNGANTDVVDVGGWKHIAVTTDTAFAMSGLVLGQEASFYDGKMGLVYISTQALSATDVARMFNEQRRLFQV